MKSTRTNIRSGSLLILFFLLPLSGAAFAQDASSSDPEGRQIEKSALSDCYYLWTRRLNNRLRVTPFLTLPLAVAEAMDAGASQSEIGEAQMSGVDGYDIELATGVSHGGPYDAMGIGTYIEVPADEWVTICNVTFRGGTLTVTEDGFRFSAETEFEE